MGFGSKKSTERLNEAMLQSQASVQEAAALKAQVNQLHELVEALWDVVRDRGGMDDDVLREAVDAVRTRVMARTVSDCPSCGRALQQGRNVCIYCGVSVEDVKALF